VCVVVGRQQFVVPFPLPLLLLLLLEPREWLADMESPNATAVLVGAAAGAGYRGATAAADRTNVARLMCLHIGALLGSFPMEQKS
jgi:hypothetical protein